MPAHATLARVLPLALALVLASGAARALNELRLEPSETAASPGEDFELTLSLAFDETTVGGAVGVSYDPAVLDLRSVAFDAALPDDPDFRCPSAALPGSVACPADPGFVSFGSVDGLPTGGPLSVAELRLAALAPGTSAVDLALASPFADTAGVPLGVSLGGTAVRVVPEPSAAALVGTGLALLAFRRPRSERGPGRPPESLV